jgi:hypothetical protein
MSEFANCLNMSGGSAESVEDFLDTSAFLHRDDSELILLINPDKERFSIVVENTSSRWPVSVKIASCEVLVTFLEKEMVSN